LISLLSLFETYGIYDLGFRELHEREMFMFGKEVVDRYGATRGDPNFWAVQLNITFPFVIGLFILHRKLWIRSALFLFSGILLLSLFTTYSISGLLGASLVLLLSLIYSANFKKKYKIAGVIITFIIAFSIFYFLPAVYKYRVTLKLSGGEDVTSGRFDTWIGGINMIISNPLFGVGPGNSMWELPRYMGIGAQFKATHNAYLAIGGETGIIGLIIFLGIILTVIKGLHQSIRLAKMASDMKGLVLGRAIYISLIVFLFQAMALDLQADKYLYILLGMAMAFKHSILKPFIYAK
jgi:O-antigen ligase